MNTKLITSILQIFALLLAVPGAYLAFKKGAIEDFKNQMIDLRNESGIGTKTVPLLYQIVAFLYFGKRKNWINLFDPDSIIFKELKSDKTSALRAIIWFILAFVCTFISVILSITNQPDPVQSAFGASTGQVISSVMP